MTWTLPYLQGLGATQEGKEGSYSIARMEFPASLLGGSSELIEVYLEKLKHCDISYEHRCKVIFISTTHSLYL